MTPNDPTVDAAFTGAAKVTLTVDLHRFVREYYDDEQNVTDPLIQAAALIVAQDVTKDIRKAVTDVIQAQVTQIVTDTLSTTFRKVNEWGEPKGEPTTLRDQIMSDAKDWFSKPLGDSYARVRPTALQKFIAEEVDRTLKAEMQAAVKDAKDAVVARVKDQAAAVITETITRSAGVR